MICSYCREDETDRNIDSAVEEERQFSRDDSAFSQSLMDIHKSLVLENELKRNANKKHGSVHRPLRRKQIVSEVQKLHDESKSLISSCSNQNMLMENKIDNPALSTPRKSMNKSEILPKPSVSQSQSKSLHPMKAKKGQPSMKRQENIPSHSVGSQKDVITNYFFPARESSFELASPSVLETADSEKHLIPEVPVTDYQILDRGTPCSSLVETSSLSKQLKNVKFDQIETTSIQEDINQDGSITNQDSKVHVDIIVRSESEFQNYDSGAYFVERDSAPHEVSCGMDNAGVTFSDDSAVAYGSRSVFRSYSNGSLNRKGLTADSPRAALLRSRSMSPRNKLRPSPIRTTSIDSMGAIQASSPRGLLVRKALCETRQELPWVPASYTPKSRHHSLSIDRDDVFIADIFDKDSTMNCTEIMKSGSPLRSTPRKKRILDLSAFVDMGETSAWWKKILLAKHKSEEYGYQTVQ